MSLLIFFNTFKFFQFPYDYENIVFEKKIWTITLKLFSSITSEMFDCDIKSCYKNIENS